MNSKGLLLFLTLSATAWAQMPEDYEDSLAKTQNLLVNKNERQEAISANPDAVAMDERIQALTGDPVTSDEVYKMAAEVMADLAKRSAGDPAKMMQELSNAQRNPAAFAEKLNPAQKSKLKTLSSQIESRKKQLP